MHFPLHCVRAAAGRVCSHAGHARTNTHTPTAANAGDATRQRQHVGDDAVSGVSAAVTATTTTMNVFTRLVILLCSVATLSERAVCGVCVCVIMVTRALSVFEVAASKKYFVYLCGSGGRWAFGDEVATTTTVQMFSIYPLVVCVYCVCEVCVSLLFVCV